MKTTVPIKTWAEDDRPREKLLQKGADALSDSELLAILIGHGYKNKSALDLSRELLELAHQNLHELGKLNAHAIQQVKGLGQAKTAEILAALELGRRRHAGTVLDKSLIRSSTDVVLYLRTRFQDLPYEAFAVLFLNKSNRVNHFEVISKGGITGTIADPRIILKKALEYQATALVLCHNHPSGNLQPSKADALLTEKIKQAALHLDISVMDHLIVSEQGYYSFADEGML